MDPLIGASLISGGLGIAGGIFGNNSAAKEARKNREWQERMDNTKYQRGVKDLTAAGLNPMLAYMGGGAHGGASTPSGAVAAQSNPVGDTAIKAVGSAVQAQLAKKQMENIDADTALKGAQAVESGAKAAQAVTASHVESNLLDSRIAQNVASAGQASQATENMRAALPKLTAEINNINAQTDAARALIAKYKSELGLIAAQTGKAVSEIRINELTAEQKSKLMPIVLQMSENNEIIQEMGMSRQRRSQEVFDNPIAGPFKAFFDSIKVPGN